jgi:hypothetical protein
MRRPDLALAAVAALALGGCDLLFPEFAGTPPDLATGDAATDAASSLPHLAGQVCVLADVRDYRTCTTGSGTFRISVEETHDVATSDATGVFFVPTARPLAIATVSVSDTAGTFAPTVTVLHPPGGVIDRVALPVMSADTLRTLSTEDGFPLDPTRGALLVWTLDATGVPVAGVRATAPTIASGPFYDGASANELTLSTATSAHGLVAIFDVTPTTLRLPLTPPAPFLPDSYDLPIRPNALTITTLALH